MAKIKTAKTETDGKEVWPKCHDTKLFGFEHERLSPCPVCLGPRDSLRGDEEDRLCYDCRSVEGLLEELDQAVRCDEVKPYSTLETSWIKLRSRLRLIFVGGLSDINLLDCLEDGLLDGCVKNREEMMRLPISGVLALTAEMKGQSGESGAKHGTNGQRDQQSVEERAITAYFSDRTLNKKQIAEKIHCHPKSLSAGRAPKLHAAIKAYKSTDHDVPHGQVSKDGSLEAWDSEK